MTQKAAREISRQLATGLAHVHKTGVIHRDIKPQNVLVSFDMDEGIVRVVLADFGLARWMPGRREVGEEAAAAKDILALSQGQGELMTRNVVTVWYRAPEIMLADKTTPRVQYTSAIDLWSLGCVVYELLKGEPLARAANEEGVLRKIVKAIGPCPSPLKASFGERLLLAEQKADALSQGHVVRDAAASEAGVCVNKMLQWKPSDRPSCEELLQGAWMQACGGQGSQASPQTEAAAAAGLAGAAKAAPSQGKAQIEDEVSAGSSGSGQGSMWRFGTQATCTTFTSLETCACSGHCYVPGHRYRGGCDAVTLLSGSRYCRSCACSVRACTRPRLRGIFCSCHRGLWDHGSLELVLTRCAHKALPWLVPCDVSDFIDLYPRVCHDQAFVVIVALLKEPSATASFVKKALELAPSYSVDDLAAALLEMLHEMRSPTKAHRTEMEALNQQGVGKASASS